MEYVRLGNCIKSLNTGLNPRQFFKLNTDDATNYYVTIKELHHNTVVFNEGTDKINDEALRLCNNRSNLEKGDVLFSGTGTIGEVAALEETPKNWNIKEGVYSIKPIPSIINHRFLMYLLQSSSIKQEYLKKAAGGTVKSVPMVEMRKLEIPLPPLPVQEEIVRVLDTFTELQAELQAELQKRLQQYNYYRDNLLSFEGRTDVEWKKLGEVMTIQRGASPRPIQSFLTDDEKGVPWIKIGDVSPQSKYISSTKEKVTKEGAAKSRYLKKGSFILSNSMSFGRPYILEIDGCIHDGWISMCDFQEYLNPDFLYHLLRSNTVQSYWVSKANSGGAVANLNSDIVRDTLIPLPSFEEQQQVVEVLDRFNALTSDLSQGLPAEIEKRGQQYEFYRDKLLTYKRKEA